MKKTFLVLYLLFATISFASAQSMDWQYATRFGGYCFQNPGVGLKLLNYPHSLEIDAEGNAYIFGTYGDNASFYDFSNGLAFDSPIYGDHCSGTFVAKFDCNGNVVWHKAMTTACICKALYIYQQRAIPYGFLTRLSMAVI